MNSKVLRKIVYGGLLAILILSNIILCLGAFNDNKTLVIFGITGIAAVVLTILLIIMFKTFNLILEKIFSRENVMFDVIYITIASMQILSIVCTKEIDMFTLKLNSILIVLTILLNILLKFINKINVN